ncbi:MAG: hypothetical protein DHS20C15_02980 [Planctomycetota bacterium]|nr:MAG: hypothetical protein DHS20C15_02980 [Planctomycetota bacterium]
MNGKLTTLLGALVGLVLAAALLTPEADEATLLGQGLSRLLAEHTKADAEIVGADLALADALSAASELPPQVTPEQRWSIFTRLAELSEPGDTVSLRVWLSEGGTTFWETTELRIQAFERAFATRLSEARHARNAAGLPDRLPSFVSTEQVSAEELAALSSSILVTATLNRAGDELQQVRFATTRDPEAAAITPAATHFGGDDVLLAFRLPGREALIPPLIAIMVALLFRKTLLALFLGILTGAVLLQHLGGAGWIAALFAGFVDVFAKYFKTELVDTFRVEIIGFVIALVAMVGVMSRAGGVRGLINLLVGFAKTVRSTLFVTWGMGLLIFFDDYANCLLVGNTMRPLTDRLRISREKLAYIVDSTAAPIAGVSVLSTWIAYEVSTYEAHLPAAGISESAYAIFLRTIPYRYYCLFTLMFVFLTIFTRRDFGPMRRAEERARSTGKLVREGGTPMVSSEATRITPREGMNNVWYHAAVPIALVLVWTLWTIFEEGGGRAAWADGSIFTGPGVAQVLFDGSGGKPIFYGATAGFLAAVFLAGSLRVRLGVAAGLGAALNLSDRVTEALGGTPDSGLLPYAAWILCFAGGALAMVVISASLTKFPRTTRPSLPLGDIRQASVSSLRALFFAILILFQAWMIGAVCGDIGTADYLVALLSGNVSAVFLPVLLFGAACLVAFSTGSSWSTMAILLPNVVALAAAVGVSEGMGALPMVVLCIGAVLEGSIFGDHCSPISDTTVLSSVASASDHIDHVRTQAPYALTTAGLAVFIGYIPTVAFDWWTWPLALGTGFCLMLLVLLLIGKRTADAPEHVLAADSEPSPSGVPATSS